MFSELGLAKEETEEESEPRSNCTDLVAGGGCEEALGCGTAGTGTRRVLKPKKKEKNGRQ